MSRFQSFRFYISWSFFLRRSPKRPGPSSRKRTRDTDHFAGWSCSTCPSGESYWIFRHGVWPDFFGGAPPLRKLRRPKRESFPVEAQAEKGTHLSLRGTSSRSRRDWCRASSSSSFVSERWNRTNERTETGWHAFHSILEVLEWVTTRIACARNVVVSCWFFNFLLFPCGPTQLWPSRLCALLLTDWFWVHTQKINAFSIQYPLRS